MPHSSGGRVAVSSRTTPTSPPRRGCQALTFPRRSDRKRTLLGRAWNLARGDRFRSAQEPSMQADGPDAWMAAMKRGDFAQAWRISDRILARRIAENDFDHTLPRHIQSIWDGRPLNDKRVLVRCYHGLGDTIQFI